MIYNKKENVIHDKPEMEKPQDSPEYYSALDFAGEQRADEYFHKYYNHLSSLISKGIPCSPSCREVWEDGSVKIEGVDYEIKSDWIENKIEFPIVSREITHRYRINVCVPLKQQDVSLIDKVNNSESEAVVELKQSENKDKIEEADKQKIVCFCGSTRFAEYFMIKRWELEKQGIITFGINILPNNYFADGNAHGAEQENVKDILDELHKRKIDLSDEVFILNVGGYIGESTRSELDYAIKIGKPVKYLEPITKL